MAVPAETIGSLIAAEMISWFGIRAIDSTRNLAEFRCDERVSVRLPLFL
jgi:hypothetical protein